MTNNISITWDGFMGFIQPIWEIVQAILSRDVPFILIIILSGCWIAVFILMSWLHKKDVRKLSRKLATTTDERARDRKFFKEELDEKKKQLESLEQKMSDEVALREASALSALRKFFGADSFSDLENAPNAPNTSSSADNGIVFNRQTITALKQMMSEIGAKITVGPSDDGRGLADNVAKEVTNKIEELHEQVKAILASAEVTLKQIVTNANDRETKLDLKKLVESALVKYQADRDNADGISKWNVPELIKEANSQLKPLGQKAVIIDAIIENHILRGFLTGDQQVLLQALKKSVEGLGLTPRMVPIDKADDDAFDPFL